MLTQNEIKELDCFERFMYQRIIKEMNNDPHIKWGNGLNTIIISDRCPGRAHGIYEYIKQKTDISDILLFQDFMSLKAYMNTAIPDIVIFVGYQENHSNYQVIKHVREVNPQVLIAMYAGVDNLIRSVCKENYIYFMYDNFGSTKGFIKNIRKNYCRV